MGILLVWFKIRVVIPNLRKDQGAKLAKDLQKDLQSWDGWRNPLVIWDHATNQVRASIDGRFFDEEQAGGTFQEMLLERTTAYLAEFDLLQVDIVDVQRLPE
jgi:hypothetical protein